MNKITQTFKNLQSANKKAFIAFITAGDPSLKKTEELVLAFEKAGVDIVELGVPFSDPMADGPTIQASSFRSLQAGTTLEKILHCVVNIRRKSDIPIMLMAYTNSIMHYGEQRFCQKAKQVGVDGLIVPDLPPEEAAELKKQAKQYNIALTFFLAPTSDPKRVPLINNATTGFIYYVSLAGVTGARQSLPSNVKQKIQAMKKVTTKPLCVGFGVSTPQQVKDISKVADGVIVGSAIVKEIEKHGKSADMVKKVAAFVKKLKK